jgi:hypothetical protein
MLRDRLSPWTRTTLALLLAGSVLSCSGEDIVFPGDDDDDDDATVTFTGTLDDVTPVTTRDIVVFVYNVDSEASQGLCVGGPTPGTVCEDDTDCGASGQCADASRICVDGATPGAACDVDADCGANGRCMDASCPCPAFPGDRSEGKAAVLESGELEFTVSGIENGAVKIVFLLDNPGDDADGQIDAGDPIAVLDDEDCELDDVEGGLTVTLEAIDIEFADDRYVDCEDGNPPVAGRARADLITQERTDGPAN